ncbi:glycosyltransferase family 2 protein [Phenylobacterium sp. VNQ135]|uniref:glycosyltransferase family 2 protein n=1 Tax=Phenylobacterium sp. VNQ135 TaxID=3400922 RepID=UPI003C06961B
MSGPVDLTIAICTYDRPELLARTLRSCLAQRNALGLRFEVVVVDNHPSGSAAAVVAQLATETAVPVRYVTETTRNMSVLRNRGFSEAAAPLVALIDDDEVADPAWTDELVGALRRTGADVAVGPRLAVFAEAPPPYDPAGTGFMRDLRLPDGADIPLLDARGKPQHGLGTGNSLFDMARCFPDGAPAMRPEFGDAGGEDFEMFVRLHRSGRRIVWASRAVVTETVLPHRTSTAYRLIRTQREAQHYVTIYLDVAPHPGRVWLSLMAKGLLQLAVGLVLATATWEFGSTRRIAGRQLMAHGLGKLLWRRPVGYIAEPPARLPSGSAS